jgi:hypothetical protein
MEIRLPNKNKKNIIILSILAFVFLASGIYLLWRVNQPETVAPEGSEAYSDPNDGIRGGEYINFPCPNGHIITIPDVREDYGQYVCGAGCMSTAEKARLCPPTRVFNINSEHLEGLYSITGVVGRGHYTNTQSQTQEDFRLSINKSPIDKPKDVTGSSTGYHEEIEEIGDFHIMQGQNTITMSHLHSCASPGVPSPMSVHLYKLCLVQKNICQGGKWLKKPPATLDYGTEINPITIKTTDNDGLSDNKQDIIVTLNGTAVPLCETKIGVTCFYTDKAQDYTEKEDNIKLLISPGQQYVAPGSYDVRVSWKDGLRIGGSNCTLQTSFTIAEEIKNPDWDITKIPAESCIDDNTENPKAKLEYTITIKNTGEGSGEITSIVDTLDSKVLETYIENISSNGKFAGGKISWTLTGTDGQFTPGQSKTYTYSLLIPKDAFGTYDNTVTAVPSEGNSLIANASVTADCIVQESQEPEEEPVVPPEEPEAPSEEPEALPEEPEAPPEEPETPPEEPLPETGIFDNSQNTLLAGFGLLILGFTWRIFGKGIFVSIEFLGKVPKKISIQMRDIKEDIRAKKRIKEMKIADKRKKNFERKVVKD